MTASHSRPHDTPNEDTTLVLGATGKTGRRVAERLVARGRRVRHGSRRGSPPFDWTDRSSWTPVLRGASAAYVAYQPDLAVPGAVDDVRAFIDRALALGTRRIVLLSGRGEEEAERAEDVLRGSGAEWTILRASWFAQNFSESFLRDAVMNGVLELPAGDVAEPFVDADDIADVATAALTEDGHAGQLYELTGPRAITFAEAARELSAATGRAIRHVHVSPRDFTTALERQGVPTDAVWLLDYLFGTVLDGRNAAVADGVRRALGREPRDFGEWARDAAARDAWGGRAHAVLAPARA